ncbi:type IV secretion system protein VirB10 [Caulobacter sp. NIBR2454]|uniref:type IV secretion system protein VirB10 n=1 Tax=Caulobacter sp. NIBR2454 TaxID=3015996 RepID=UPI0022B746FD|nr:type IV secretion system protein VirB10 [Caulobacter sp. NIBR2454]
MMLKSKMKSAAAEPSAVFALDGVPGAAVARPDSKAAPLIGLGFALVIGGVVFMTLSQSRAARAQATPTAVATPEPAAEQPTPAPEAVTPPPATMLSPDPASFSPMVEGEDPSVRWRAPAMVVDISEAPQAVTMAAQTGGRAPVATTPAPSMASPDERFSERVGSTGVETARATRLRDTRLIIPQGAVIAAVLETGINSDLPGFVRAVVSRDVRGFDGSTVLIPRGSKLIGQYRAGVAVGQTRAFVVWSRVLTPDGVSVEIGSPSADSLGRGGLEGETNSHFLRRFGASIVLSVISSGLQALGGDRDGGTAIVIGSQQQANNIASIALQKQIDIPVTITVLQGAPVRVFVARDLDFSGVASAR